MHKINTFCRDTHRPLSAWQVWIITRQADGDFFSFYLRFGALREAIQPNEGKDRWQNIRHNLTVQFCMWVRVKHIIGIMRGRASHLQIFFRKQERDFVSIENAMSRYVLVFRLHRKISFLGWNSKPENQLNDTFLQSNLKWSRISNTMGSTYLHVSHIMCISRLCGPMTAPQFEGGKRMTRTSIKKFWLFFYIWPMSVMRTFICDIPHQIQSNLRHDKWWNAHQQKYINAIQRRRWFAHKRLTNLFNFRIIKSN